MKFVIKTFNPLPYAFACLIITICFVTNSISGQTPTGNSLPGMKPMPIPTVLPIPSKTSTASPESRFFKNILQDQKAIWTSPFHLSHRDTSWLLPLGVITTGLIATDRFTSSWVDRFGSLPAVSHNTSQGGAFYTTGGTALGIYLAGRISGNRRLRETGLLVGEALIDSEIVTQALKFTTQRSRPNEKGGHGRFFSGGNSFPSGHATAIWTLATVTANEYHDKPLIKYGSYGLAVLITMSRYSGRNHYLSDLLIGSAIGYGIGRFVYQTHHDKSLDGGTDLTFNRQPPHYIPQIKTDFNRRTRTYQASLIWSW